MAGWLLGLLVLAGCTLPIPFADHWFFTTVRSQLPEAADCQRCHGEIYDEWRGSAHAHAWTAESFVAFTSEHAAGDCLSCHAPAPLGRLGEVQLRDDHLDEGVTCVSCHLSPDPRAEPLTMRGPHERTSPVDAHPIVSDPLFRKADLCGTCHEGVLREWEASPEPQDGSERKICQDCHMQKVRRTMESYNPDKPYSAVLVALGKVVDGRRHRFAVPDDAWEDIDVRLEVAPDSRTTRVSVTNKLPHAIPTGTFGRRVVRLRVRWPGGEASQLLHADLDQAIGAGETRLFEFPQLPPNLRPTAVLERRDPSSGVFQRLAPAPSESAAERTLQ
jgi:hypothetical protein